MTPDTIRYYERVGLLPPPARDRGGRRRYDERTVRQLELVRSLRRAGLSVAEIRSVIAAKRPGADARANLEAVAEALRTLRGSVEERRQALDEALVALDGLLAEVRAATAGR